MRLWRADLAPISKTASLLLLTLLESLPFPFTTKKHALDKKQVDMPSLTSAKEFTLPSASGWSC